MHRIMFLDLETENHEYFGALSSPRCPENYVVAVGWALDSGPVQHKYYTSKQASKDWLDIPEDVWLIVGHNLSFELDWMYTQHPQKLTEYINRGGMLYCTQLGEFRLSRQVDLYPDLDTTAPKYGGTHKVDAVKLLWEQGKLTSEIDPELLIEYLAGPGGDIENTRKTFYGQHKLLQERGMWDILLAQCNGLLFNSICMANGVYINREVAQANLKELQAQVNQLEERISGALQGFPPEIRAGFKLSSLYHCSAWIYGGSMRVPGQELSVDKEGNQRYVKADAVQCADTKQYHILGEGEDPEGAIPNPVRFVRGKNQGKVKVFRIDTDTPLMRNANIPYHAPGVVNLQDYPPEFREDFLKSYTTALKQYDDTPIISTSEQAFQDLTSRPETSEEAKELLQALLDYSALDKIIGTFYIKDVYYADGRHKGQSGALQYLTDADRIHHSLNVCATTTGRLSSTRPNYQNLPTSKDAGVHRCIESRFGASGVIMEVDYSNLEVVVLADLSKDKNLMDIVRSGKSMHTINASAIKGITYEEYDAILKDREHPLHEEYAQFREDCKPKEFSANYGASARGVAYAAGCSIEEAQEFLDTKVKMFPDVEAFVQRVVEAVHDNSSTQRELDPEGRWRIFHTGYFKAPGGIEYSFRTYPRTEYTRQGPVETQAFRPTQIRNYPIQGEASLFVQCATGWLIRSLFARNFYDGRVVPFNTVHDSVWLDVHKDCVDQAVDLVRACLEYIPRGMAQLGYTLDLDYPVDITVGPNLQDQYPISNYKEYI